MIKKILSYIGDIFLVIIFVLSCIILVSSQINGHSSFVNYSLVQVQSGSMTASGIIKGDVVLIHPEKNYEVGDIIAFHNDDSIWFHEIIGKTTEGFITQGSSNAYPDDCRTTYDEVVGKLVLPNLRFNWFVSSWFQITLIIIIYILNMYCIIYLLIQVLKDTGDEEEQLIQTQQPEPVIVPTTVAEENKPKQKKIYHHKVKQKILIGMLVMLAVITPTAVYAATSNSLSVTAIISFIHEEKDWTDSNKLTEEAYEVATDFEYAINNPETEEGQAWTDAWSEKNTSGNSYVGSMDKDAGEYVSQVFHLETEPDASIIVKRKSNNEYYVYVTYEKLDRGYGTVQPVYRTKYVRDSNGNLVPTQSWVGRCNRNIYSVYQLTTYSFNTETFVEI